MSRVQFHDLDVHHLSFYDEERADEIFEQLEALEFNSDEDSKVLVFGQYRQIPRKQVAFGDTGTSYNFSGNTVPARDWNESSGQFLRDIADELREWMMEEMNELESVSSTRPNFVLVNLYRDGNDNIGFHSDDEKDLAGQLNSDTGEPETVIFSLSFGATRDFVFQHRNAKALKKTFELKHGDLCVMRGKTQQYWKHSLPKRLRVKNKRYNLTFRFMV